MMVESKATAPAGDCLSLRSHYETILVDRAGRLQLPRETFEHIPFNGRAAVRIASYHVELWPVSIESSIQNVQKNVLVQCQQSMIKDDKK